ncbi:Uncharacterised protein [Mycobacteroides abscessus subsp. abscessus]|nr:Uncharacterised protein [Mycobacteroides abscessus subsp. abscessus]
MLQGVRNAGVGEPDRQVGAALAGRDDGRHRRFPVVAGEMLEVDIPQPGQVFAIGHLAVHRDDEPVGVGVDHRQGLLPAGRILGQQ